MINLLPPEHASAIRYGRQNTILRKRLIGMAFAVAGLIIILAAGWVYINQQTKSLRKGIDATNQQLQVQDLKGVQADAKEISGDIKVINQVLGNEINFSSLVQAIGQVVPHGAVLGSLSLSKIDGAIDLSANTADTPAAAQLAANLSDPKNGLFYKVDVVSVNCVNAKQAYPCTATFKALFLPTVKTKFLSVPKGSG